MRKWRKVCIVLTLSLLATAVATGQTTKTYSEVTLTGGFAAGHFGDKWDLTQGDLTVAFTYDATGLVDNETSQWQDHAWAELGVRACGYGDFNPTYGVEGAGVWLATDYDEWQTLNTFNPDPTGSPTLDLDDKLILQKGGGMGEGAYNLPAIPPAPGNNHRVWWDRDGVDPWQNPATANTGGLYGIVIYLHATSATTGTAYMKIRGLWQGFEVDGNWSTIELTPAGMTFTGDMKKMQVFYGLYGYGPEGTTHTVAFTDIAVSGYLGDNAGPVTSGVVAEPVVPGGSVVLTAEVDDTATGGSNIERADYSLDGGPWTAMAAQDGAFDETTEAVAATFTAPSAAGVYNLCVRGKDVACNTGAPECIMLAVYDPSGGFVTGGGWIDSPPGAYVPDSSLAGKANFGFVSKYQKGATVPTGNTEFQFKAGDLNFHSTSYDWLVVTGSDYARFKGIGTINGSGPYKFMLWAGDKEPDTFRIRIWTEDETGVETVVYDNGTDQPIGGGSIVIHTK